MMTAAQRRPVALITGAARRIGRTIALSLAAGGYDIAVHYQRSQADAETLVAELRDIGAAAVAIPCDLADAACVSELVPQVAACLGHPSCLINNASVFEHDTIATLTTASWERHHSINLRAPIILAQALYLGLPSDSEGNVINIIDQRVLKLTPDFFSYTVSKAGLWTATKTLAQAMSPRVRVNAIGPGPVLRSIHQTEADFAAEEAATLLKRGASPAEIAAAIRFLLQAPAITGQMIVLDGGQHLAWL
jgi:NAD(P)-dependent dehydrogenase (short-subunit alcohol dehydrogenase family)